MGENPSSPGDGLEDALRRALSDAVGRIEPGTDGLDSIHARISGRPPRPWLLAILSGAVERARFWTWRGHWAWPGSLLARANLTGRVRRRRHRAGIPAEKPSRRGGRFPLPGLAGILGEWRVGWLTLVAGLAGMAVIASVSFGVQPVRQVIIQAGTTVLHGGAPYPPLPRTGAGTDGTGTPTPDSSGPLAAVGPTAVAQPSPTSALGSRGGGPGGVRTGAAAPATCQPATTGATKRPTSTTPTAPTTADTGTAASTSSAAGTVSSGAAQPANPTASSSTRPPAQPAATPDSPATSAPTCAVSPGPTTTTTPTATPTATPTPTPTTQPAVTGGPSTPTDDPTGGTTTPTPAGTPTSTATSTPTSSPTGTPTGAGSVAVAAASVTPAPHDVSPTTLAESGSWRWYARLRFMHHRRHRERR